jgi:hypothetical protein
MIVCSIIGWMRHSLRCLSLLGNEIALYTVLQTEDAVNYGAFNISLDGQSPQTWPGATPMTDQTSTDPMPNMLVVCRFYFAIAVTPH